MVQAEFLRWDHKPTPAERFATIKKITAEMWAASDEATIATVTDALEADKAAKHAANVYEEVVDRTPADYQQYVSNVLSLRNLNLTQHRSISELPATLKAVFDELSVTTGWSFTVLMGGPYPKDGGSIQTAS